MKDESRREVLSRLGVGVAAVAAAVTAGEAMAQPKMKRAVAVKKPGGRMVKVRRTGEGDVTQIRVNWGRGGGFRVSEIKGVRGVEKAGWNIKGRENSLTLGVRVKGEQITIEGLNGGQFSADGRCNASLREAGVEVSNPAPIRDIRQPVRRR